MRTTFFTCCNKDYEDFIPIFIHSILYHNKDVDIEIGIETELTENFIKCIKYIKEKYVNSKIEIKNVDFGNIIIEDKSYYIIPNTVRFLNTPKIKNEYIYICDIDIITLQKNIQQKHIDDMKKTGLNYSNIVRPSSIDKNNRRLTGLHFSKWDNYYPIPNYDDLIKNGMLKHDEVFLYNLVKKNNEISDTNTYRPVHGIHVSPNRPDINNWGIKQWKKEWIKYRNSDEFLYLEKFFPDRIINIIKKIDKYFE